MLKIEKVYLYILLKMSSLNNYYIIKLKLLCHCSVVEFDKLS